MSPNLHIFGAPYERRGFLARARGAIHAFSPFERVVFMVLLTVFVGSTAILAMRANAMLLVEIPAEGGTIIEGAIGVPRFINPLIAESDTERDLVSLIYAGLLDRDPNGMLSGELAETYSISEDGLTYRFTLRDNLTFHDGSPVTADDVAFTIALAQNPTIESPYRVDFAGVTVSVLSPLEVEFKLPSPYAPFLENMTIGILPRHIWETAQSEEIPTSQFNIEPIGAGPYKIDFIERDSSGIATSYHLEAFNDYARNEPHIRSIVFTFFRNEADVLEALAGGTINAASGISSAEARAYEASDTLQVVHAPLPRTFGVFFNYNRAQMLAKTEVRRALSLVLDRSKIVDASLGGFGVPLATPFLDIAGTTTPADSERATTLLENGGWTRRASDNKWVLETKESTTELAFTITTAEVPELLKAAEEVARQWNEFGASVSTTSFPPADLALSVIRPRKFDTLLFGMVTGREHDLYPFWHSSQRNDPGLNIASYANIDADSALTTLREETNPEERTEALGHFLTEVATDAPAAFLFAPELVYVAPKSLQNASLNGVTSSADRFATVSEWYMNTDTVWPFLENVFK